VFGLLATHPQAMPFAREVLRIHRRYAAEVVSAFGLCPFLRDVDVGLGRFCVMLDPTPRVDHAEKAALMAGTSVAHLVYPCVVLPAVELERFAASLAERLKRVVESPPVMAVFHPELSGDPTTPHRLVGILRRAPDPFVQLVPEGLHQGGTVFAGAADDAAPDPAQKNFDRLAGPELARMLDALATIHADRARAYAPFRATFARA